MRNKKIVYFLFLAFFPFCPALGEEKFPGLTEKSEYSWQLIGDMGGVFYYHDRSEQQLGELYRGKNSKVDVLLSGLTRAPIKLSYPYSYYTHQDWRTGMFRAWVGAMKVYFYIPKFEVFIERDYLEGTCRYNIVLAHENQHVAFRKKLYPKYRAMLEDALERDQTIPTVSAPLTVESKEAAGKEIRKRIDRVILPVYRKYVKELDALNKTIDNEKNYHDQWEPCRKQEAQNAHWVVLAYMFIALIVGWLGEKIKKLMKTDAQG